jgi:hypothetical protein
MLWRDALFIDRKLGFKGVELRVIVVFDYGVVLGFLIKWW